MGRGGDDLMIGLYRPRIGVTTRRADDEWVAQNVEHYMQAIERAGGIGVVLAPETAEASPATLEGLDGLLLSGGGDVHPSYYGQPIDGTEETSIDLARDELEIVVTRRAVERDLPILGICRGIQVLNVALGGRLVQHVNGHRTARPDFVQHDVRIVPGSRLACLLDVKDTLRVNSYHHQAVTLEYLAPRLTPAAYSLPDEHLLEAVESSDRRWVIGVQWHPERADEVPAMHSRLFQAFVQAARDR